MHGLDDVGLGQREQIVVAFQVARGAVRVVRVAAAGETFAAIAGFVELVALQHRAHRAVDDEDAVA